ncbi:MAG: flavodoxin family protein [Phycisphaerae bacterium]|nr:flavodoxin family protein [Phycisphaerae bacterium]MDP7288366.1 flavodoxin family protein [Phycisphaerae bacterium]
MRDNLTRRMFLGSAPVALAATAATAALADKGSAKTAATKIIGVSCSPRKGKNTAAALAECLAGAKGKDGIQTELIELAGLDIDGSVAAGVALPPGRKDDFPIIGKKLADPSVGGIIIGTPVYFSSMTSVCKAFIERLMVFWRSGGLSGKAVGVVAVGGSRNGGQEVTIRSVQDCLFCYDMVLVGTGRRFGAAVWSKGGAAGDKQGMGEAKKLGLRVAETAILLKG